MVPKKVRKNGKYSFLKFLFEAYEDCSIWRFFADIANEVGFPVQEPLEYRALN